MKTTNFDKIFKAIEMLTNKHLVYLHDESKGYCVKFFTGEWKVFNFNMVNDIAGLGYINNSLL